MYLSPSTTGGFGSFCLIEIDAGPALLPDKCICFVLSFVYLSMPCICIYVCDLPCIFICGFAFALQLYLCEFIYLVLSLTTTLLAPCAVIVSDLCRGRCSIHFKYERLIQTSGDILNFLCHYSIPSRPSYSSEIPEWWNRRFRN